MINRTKTKSNLTNYQQENQTMKIKIQTTDFANCTTTTTTTTNCNGITNSIIQSVAEFNGRKYVLCMQHWLCMVTPTVLEARICKFTHITYASIDRSIADTFNFHIVFIQEKWIRPRNTNKFTRCLNANRRPKPRFQIFYTCSVRAQKSGWIVIGGEKGPMSVRCSGRMQKREPGRARKQHFSCNSSLAS